MSHSGYPKTVYEVDHIRTFGEVLMMLIVYVPLVEVLLVVPADYKNSESVPFRACPSIIHRSRRNISGIVAPRSSENDVGSPFEGTLYDPFVGR